MKIKLKYLFAHLCITLLCGHLISGSDHPFKFSKQPRSRLVKLGQKVKMECSTNQPDAQISWMLNDRPILPDPNVRQNRGRLSIQVPFAEQDPLMGLSLERIRKSKFQCVARFNDETILSHPVKLLISKLDNFSEHENGERLVTAIQGSVAILPCNLPDSVPKALLEYELNNGQVLQESNDRFLLMPSGSLQIVNVQHQDSGRYRCIAHNAFLNQRRNSSLALRLQVDQVSTSWMTDLKFSVQPPHEIRAVMGTNLTLECATNALAADAIHWKRVDGKYSELSDRHVRVGSNLQIVHVNRQDEGIYVCSASDHRRTIETRAHVRIQLAPAIIRPLQDMNFLADQAVRLDCSAHGWPTPEYTWYHNGKMITHQMTTQSQLRLEEQGALLYIQRARYNDQGVYQCFVSSELGTVHATARLNIRTMLQSASGSGSGSGSGSASGSVSNHHHYAVTQAPTPALVKADSVADVNEYASRVGPPSDPSRSRPVNIFGKPNIYRISSDSVMVNWNALSVPGKTVAFYKVQYKLIGSKNNTWNTVEEDIAPHINSISITGLKLDARYRFRVFAVFSTNEQHNSAISDRFKLTRNPTTKKPQHVPNIVFVKPLNTSSIEIKWNPSTLGSGHGPDMPSIDGYFIHYRLTQSAESYHKITVKGEHVNRLDIHHLQSGREYEIKIQSFNAAGGSDFSRLVTVRTLSDANTSDDNSEDSDEADTSDGNHDNDDNGDEDDDHVKETNPSPPDNSFDYVPNTLNGNPNFKINDPTTNVNNPNSHSNHDVNDPNNDNHSNNNNNNNNHNHNHVWNLSSTPSSVPEDNHMWNAKTSTSTAPSTASGSSTTSMTVNPSVNHDSIDTSGFSVDVINKQIEPEVHTNNVDDGSGDASYNRRLSNMSKTFDDEYFKRLIPVVAGAASIVLMLICCVVQCRRSFVQRKERKHVQQTDMMAQKEALYSSRGSLRRPTAIVPTNGGAFSTNVDANNHYMTIGGSRAALNSSRLAMNGGNPMNLNGSIRMEPVYGMTGGTLGRHSVKPLLQSHTVATLDRHRQRIRQFEDHYATGQQFATINRSNSFVRLNGTLERKRRSRPDLFSVIDMKDSVTALDGNQPTWPAGPSTLKQPIYGESKLNHYTIAEEN